MTRSQVVGLLRIPLWEFAESSSASKINERDGVSRKSRAQESERFELPTPLGQNWDSKNLDTDATMKNVRVKAKWNIVAALSTPSVLGHRGCLGNGGGG